MMCLVYIPAAGVVFPTLRRLVLEVLMLLPRTM
jgi:hypothetical protein